MDRLSDYIIEQCVVDQSCSVFAGVLYSSYKVWCEESGEHPMTQTAFGLALGERGYLKKTVQGKRKYVGIGLSVTIQDSRVCG